MPIDTTACKKSFIWQRVVPAEIGQKAERTALSDGKD